MKRKLSAAVFFAAAAILAFAASAGAVDGTIEINQAKVTANGGFPYVISTANTSYRLTGSLTVTSTTVSAITVNAQHVTIDLNGFSISGPGGSTSTGNGINGSGAGVMTVENGGLISGFSTGVYTGTSGIVRNLHADANKNGIETGNNSVVKDCTANVNVASGIIVAQSSVISGNAANSNGGDGILVNGNADVISGNTANYNSVDGILMSPGNSALVIGNTIMNNTVYGLNAASAAYRENVFLNNGSSSSDNILDGSSLGNNLCGSLGVC